MGVQQAPVCAAAAGKSGAFRRYGGANRHTGRLGISCACAMSLVVGLYVGPGFPFLTWPCRDAESIAHASETFGVFLAHSSGFVRNFRSYSNAVLHSAWNCCEQVHGGAGHLFIAVACTRGHARARQKTAPPTSGQGNVYVRAMKKAHALVSLGVR